jgi:hypothetical protein
LLIARFFGKADKDARWSEKRINGLERLFVSALPNCGFVSDSLSVLSALTILGVGHAVSAKRGR